MGVASPCLQASDDAVFLSGSGNPFIQIHSPPVPVRAGAGAASWSSAWAFTLTNNSIGEEDPGEDIVIDGETYRLVFDLRYRLRDGLDVGLTVPLVAHRGGVLDSVIWEWHELFGFTNKERRDFARNELRYAYTRDGERRVDVADPAAGVGDVRLSTAWRIASDAGAGRTLAVQAGLKLPTGDEARLHGSGSTDLSLQLVGADAGLLSSWRTRLFWSAGVLRLGDGGPLGDLRREWVPLGSVALERPLRSGILLKAQVDAHGSFYHSGLKAFGMAAVQVMAGAGIRIGRGGMLDLAIVEDLFVDPTPDFGVHLAWRSLL